MENIFKEKVAIIRYGSKSSPQQYYTARAFK